MKRFTEALFILFAILIAAAVVYGIREAQKAAGQAERICPICGQPTKLTGSFKCNRGIHTPVGEKATP